MYRRLFFLFPSPKEAHQVVNELEGLGIDQADIHAYSPHKENLSFLPASITKQKHDTASLLEKIIWNANLVIFFMALTGLLAALLYAAWGWVAFTSMAILVTVTAGYHFKTQLPDTHLDEFKSAMTHDDVVLSVDVPKNKMPDVEALIHNQHPKAVDGGVSWSLHAFGL